MVEWRGSNTPGQYRSDSQVTLLDILDKVLDKGLVVAGDIRISLVNVELLTVKVRLLVCSIDKAVEIGLDWWRQDSFLSSTADDPRSLEARLQALEQRLAPPAAAPPPRARRERRIRPAQDRTGR